jgi:hypothetical protein
MDFSDRDELEKRMQRRKRRRRNDIFWNFLTVCTVLATVALTAFMLLIYSNPYMSINPFPPPTMPALINLPTSTPTPLLMPATWTPAALVTGTPSPTTEIIKIVPSVSATTSEAPTGTSEAVATAEETSDSVYSFALQAAPSAVKSETFKAGSGCDWQGIAGQVVDMQGRHLVNTGIMIVLKGTYNNKTIDTQTIPGTHTEYGDSGYEFQLGTSLVKSSGLLSIQLVDQAGLPLSDKVIFDTYDSCDKNLVLINFRQVK